MQSHLKLPTSMEDIQAKYQKIPYGWREIDIAASYGSADLSAENKPLNTEERQSDRQP